MKTRDVRIPMSLSVLWVTGTSEDVTFDLCVEKSLIVLVTVKSIFFSMPMHNWK